MDEAVASTAHLSQDLARLPEPCFLQGCRAKKKVVAGLGKMGEQTKGRSKSSISILAAWQQRKQKNRLADSHMPFLTNFRQSLGDYRISGIKPSVLMPGATFKAVRTEDSPNSYTATPRPKRTTFELIFGW